MAETTVALYIPECSKRPSSKAAASEEARRTLRYVEPLRDARTPLEDFFSILLERCESERVAEREGFEPSVEILSLRRFSKPLPSATRPPLRVEFSINYVGLSIRLSSAE